MNIILPTNSENKKLEFRNCKKFGDRSGYKVEVYVKSGTIIAEIDFYFEEFPLRKFIDDLTKINLNLIGEATLKPLFEDDYITMAALPLGHVSVEGQFSVIGEYDQRLSFGFETDQTTLPEFLEQLKNLSHA